MTKKDYLIAKELKEKLPKEVDLVDFKVFGSCAKGAQDEFSDMDVFIEVENLNKELEEKVSDITWEVGFNNSIYISPLIFTRYEIEDSPLRASPIVKNINKEGIKV